MERKDQEEMDRKGAEFRGLQVFGTLLGIPLAGMLSMTGGCWEQETRGKSVTIEQTYNGKTNCVRMVAIPQKSGINIFTGDALFGRCRMVDNNEDGSVDKVIFDKPAIAFRMAYSPGYYNEITNKTDLERHYQEHYSRFYREGRKVIHEGGFKIRPYY